MEKISGKCPILHRGIIILFLRLFLGGLFIYASSYKIIHNTRFKNTVANYEILPYWMINITSIILPWLELLIGALLIIGIFVRSCAFIQCLLLALFIVAIGINIARGLEFYCGCFTEDSTIGGMNYWHIVINILLLSSALILFILERRRFSHRFFQKHFVQK